MLSTLEKNIKIYSIISPNSIITLFVSWNMGGLENTMMNYWLLDGGWRPDAWKEKERAQEIFPLIS